MQVENKSVDRFSCDDMLINSIQSKQWDLVKDYVHQANLPDEDDDYPLHYLCSSNDTPIHILQLIYNTFPEAVYHESSDGSTPLFNAVFARFVEAVDFLSRRNPDTVLIRNLQNGLTPLQLALDYSEPNYMMDDLLFANPSAVFMENNKLDVIFDGFFIERNCSIRVFLNSKKEFGGFGSHAYRLSNVDLDYKIRADEIAWRLRDVYFKSILLLKAVTIKNFNRNTVMDNSRMLLHSAFKEDACPWSFCSSYLRLHPEQAMIIDSDGNLPFHILAASSNKNSDMISFKCDYCGKVDEIYYFESNNPYSTKNTRRLCQYYYGADSPNQNYKVTTMSPVLKVPCLIQDLLSLNPLIASLPDRNGHYPLHISISFRQVFTATKQIFDACQRIGRENNNLVDGLISFKSAAVDVWKDKLDQINTILYLLLGDPALIYY